MKRPCSFIDSIVESASISYGNYHLLDFDPHELHDPDLLDPHELHELDPFDLLDPHELHELDRFDLLDPQELHELPEPHEHESSLEHQSSSSQSHDEHELLRCFFSLVTTYTFCTFPPHEDDDEDEPHPLLPPERIPASAFGSGSGSPKAYVFF